MHLHTDTCVLQEHDEPKEEVPLEGGRSGRGVWGQYLLDPSRSWSDGVRTYPHGPSTEGVAALEHRHRVHDALVEHLPSLRPILASIWVYADSDDLLSKHQQQSSILHAYAAKHCLMWNVRYPPLPPHPLFFLPTYDDYDSYDSHDDDNQTALWSVNEEDYNDVHLPCTVYGCEAAVYGCCNHSVFTEYRSSSPWFDGHHTHASGPTREDVAALESRHDLAQLLALHGPFEIPALTDLVWQYVDGQEVLSVDQRSCGLLYSWAQSHKLLWSVGHDMVGFQCTCMEGVGADDQCRIHTAPGGETGSEYDVEGYIWARVRGDGEEWWGIDYDDPARPQDDEDDDDEEGHQQQLLTARTLNQDIS